MEYKNNIEFARELDNNDPLKEFRDQFYIPLKNDKPLIYFIGNSTGLQPKNVRSAVEQELKDWEVYGLDAHFEAKNPWYYYHHFLSESIGRITGAKPEETVVMNSLTTNLHLMMVSFYQPDGNRNKIMMEAHAFPSDIHAVTSQMILHGVDPKQALIELQPAEGEFINRNEDILQAIEKHGDELAMILIGGVNYYTGQVFDMKSITEAGHKVGAKVGFDLAHGIGNIPFQLHDWDVDWAAWCSYKYLNSGPGGAAGVFVHERHGQDKSLRRLSGWWGTEEETRFEMSPDFIPQSGAAGWQLSNAPVFPMAIQKASLEVFDNAGFDKLREKSKLLTGYLVYLLNEMGQSNDSFEIITPSNPEERGCQVSIFMKKAGKMVYDKLKEAGVKADWRHPDVIRIAPVPLYNSFEEVWEFASLFASYMETVADPSLT
ncbi:MAG: kynureninase [Bacteroidetes bacterium]|nr:kynureninase [Bacteroidota bacterium]